MTKNPGWLIIFDNADKSETVKSFLPVEAQGHILVTSRAQVFDALGIAKPLEITEMSLDEARKFLFKRTGREENGGQETGAASDLAEELGCLPLALEQAGAFILENKSRFKDYLKSYCKRRLELLEERGPVTGNYPESVRTTWAMNFREVEQASAPAADVLRLSALLSPDDIPLELLSEGTPELGPALSTVLTDFKDDPLVLDKLLTPLTRFSLIHRAIESQTYSIHRLVQAVLRSEMDIQAQHLWVERAVRSVTRVFPTTGFENWQRCERLLPHARVCADLIDAWGLRSQESTALLSRLSAYLRQRGYADEAYRLAERTSKMGKEVISGALPISLILFAAAARDRGDHAEAERILLSGLAIAQNASDPDQATVAACLNDLGGIYRLQAQYAKSESLLQRALEMRIKLYGPQDKSTARSFHDLGLLYYDQGLYAEAEPLLRRALEVWEAVLQLEDPDIARALDSLARLCTSQGKYTEAESLFERSIAIAEKSLLKDNPRHPRVALILDNYAVLLRRMAREAEAHEKEVRAEVIRTGQATKVISGKSNTVV